MFVEYIRGGGARYAYGDIFDEKVIQGAQPNLVLNQPLLSTYKDIIPLKKLRRMHLRIIAGIEMFYGNFKRFKLFYAMYEIPELAEYIALSSKIKTMQLEDAHRLLEQGKGMAAVDELLRESDRLEKQKKELFEKITTEKKDVLETYNITIEEIYKL